MNGKIGLLAMLGYSLLMSCASSQKLVNRGLTKQIQADGLFDDHLFGAQIYDPKTKEEIYAVNAHKLFIPASNVKLLTLYTAIKTLDDLLITYKHKTIGNQLYIWGMADPTTLHPTFGDQQDRFDVLRKAQGDITFCQNHISFERYGPGWAWDDHKYAYQAERSFFPLYANQMWYTGTIDSSRLLSFYPRAFEHTIHRDSLLSYTRNLESNRFMISTPDHTGDQFHLNIPIRTSNDAFLTLMKQIVPTSFKISKQCPDQQGAAPVFGSSAIEAYKTMMQESDNFLAEHLLLMCAGATFGELNQDAMIKFVKNEYLQEVKDEIVWVDGSGLSRYNLISPAALVVTLDKLLDEMSWEEIKYSFAAGGQSGTLQNWYHNVDGITPYIYAKTGTLTGNHCLSGYLITDGGRRLIFSFMHNNYAGYSSVVKEKMERLVQFIKHNY